MGLHQKVALTLVVLMALGTLDPPKVDAQLCFYYLSSIRSRSISVYTYYWYRVYYYWRCGWWGWRRCGGSYVVYVYYTYYYTSYQVYYIQKHYCCYGYSGANCDPICNNNCYKCTNCLSPWNCACQSGWTGYNCCSDYNECGYNNGGCEQNCHNTVGSWYCSCNSGYTKSGSHCIDVNECLTNNGGCDHNCHNTNGGYSCTCQTGYYLSGGKYCYDVNECNTNNGGCEQNCINQPGTYHCTCNEGFDLASDKHDCDDHNECTNGVANCNQNCQNTPGGYYCYCNTGYELDIDDETCIDTNECNNNNGGCAQHCTNTIGSYYCTCDGGYNLHSDDHACVDIDECALDTDGCDHFCYNNIGGYTCDCKVGYSLHDDDHSCHDINECNTDNGGCEHTCVNEIGTYHCECNIGWLLDDNAHTCSDHDECATNVHDCDTLAPATCHNLQGSFYCTCPIGFRLNADGRTCDDINECDENTSGCSQICNNIYGSYFCTCHTGFSLDSDQHGCSDIDECQNNPCENTCHNLVGSYYCSCNTGYQLTSDQHTCVGIPCDPQLEAPEDGGILCTGDQVTGESCEFSCRPGFELMGSASRTCQANSLWTGVTTYCQHLHCPELQEPTNGYISTVPCTSYFESTCEVKCVDGYYVNGPSPHIETCAVNADNELYWYPQYTCQYIPPCKAQPCKHDSTCHEVTMTSYYCDCGDSLFTGLNCEIGVISVGEFPVINVGDTLSVPISGTPDSSVSVSISVSSTNVKFNQSAFTFDPNNPTSSIDISVSEPGVYSIAYQLSGEDADNYETPDTSILIVVDPDYEHVKDDYFLKHNVPVGTLVEGCCSPGVQYQCPGGVVNTVSFSSTCAWDNLDADEFSTPGVVFAKGDGIDIPISISGAHIMMTEESYSGFVLPDLSEECRECDNTDPTCNYFMFKPNDYIDLLEARALETTYLKAIDGLLPDWLTITIDQLHLTGQTAFGIDDFTSYLTTGENIYEIPGCESLDLEPDSLFVVLSQDNNITADVDGISMKYMPSVGDDPVCFAINLCKGSSSPVHVTVPSQAMDYVTSFAAIQAYISKGWSFTFKEFLLSSNDLTFMGDGHTSLAPYYWVGTDDMVDSSKVVPDFELRTYVNMDRTFCQPGDIYPCVDAAFSGDVYYQSSPQGDDVQGLLSGDLTLSLNMTVNGKTGHMTLFTTSTAALFTMPGQGSSTSAVRSGITMHSTYNRNTMDQVFNDILPIPEGQDSCPVDVFISLTDEEHIDYIRMRSNCLNVRVGGYLYDGDFTHDIYISGNSAPTTPTDVPEDTVLAVFSYLNEDEIQMTDFYSIQKPSSGEAAIVSTFGSSADSSKATIPQAHLSILGTTFTTSLDVSPEGIMFSTDGMVALYGGFETTLSGTIPLGSSWDDFVVDIQGTFANDQGSFQSEVQGYVYEFADSIVEDSENRIEATEMASADADYTQAQATAILNSKQNAINELKAAKDQAMNNYNQANQTYNAAMAAFNTAYSSASEEAMQAIGLLKNVCMAREANWTCDECLPSSNCRLMSMSKEIMEWGLKKRTHSESRLVHSVRDVTKLKWGIENQCQLITLIRGWGRTVTSQRCSYIATYDNITETMLDAYYDTVEVMRTEAAVTETGTFSYDKKQYLVDTCIETVSASTCQYTDAACDVGRKIMLEALQNDGNVDVVTAFINLENAKRAMVAAETTMKATNTAYKIAVDEYASLQVCLQYSDPNLASNIQTIIDEEGSIQTLKTTLQNTNIQDLFSINSIDFDAGYTDSDSLPVMINYNVLGNARVLTTTVEFTATSELINRAIADAILVDIGNYLAGNRKRRQAVENSFNEDQFQTRCGQLNGITLYLEMIYDSLQSTQDTYMMAMANITQTIAMVDNLLNSVPTEYPTVDFQYLKDMYNYEISIDDLNTQISSAVPVTNRTAALMHLKKTLMDRMDGLSDYYYRCWQNDLKKLHSQGFVDTVGHIRCYGVVDCLNLVHEVIKNIVSDMPDSTVKTDLLSSLPMSRKWLIEMSLYNSTLTMETALATNATGMISLIRTIMDQQYWCTDIPMITKHPDSQISVQVGDTLTVKCMADSVLPITYSFERNGFLVATGLTSGEFTIVASEYDSGLYQCFASNAVGTVQSMLSNVVVYVAPKIVLSPSRYETFEGDDNGGFFACNATGYPEPMYEWEYLDSTGKWNTVADSKSNELVIPKPSEQDERWYRCKVQTEGSGVIYSEPAHLSVLNVTFSRLSYQVSFRMNSTELDLTPGSGDEMAPTPPTETVTLNYFRDQLNLTYTTVDDLHVDFSPDNTEIAVHITMSVSMNYTPSLPFDDQADMAYMKKQDLMQGLTNLQEHVKDGTFWFESEGSYFKAAHLSANVRDPIYTCPSNYILAYSNFLCVTCSPGTFYSMVNGRGACTACPLTTYSSMDGQTKCIRCPSQTDTLGTGSMWITDCIDYCQHNYYSETGLEKCTRCPDNTYAYTYRATSCDNCTADDIGIKPECNETTGTSSPIDGDSASLTTVIVPSVLGGLFALFLLVVLIVVGIVMGLRRRKDGTSIVNTTYGGQSNPLYSSPQDVLSLVPENEKSEYKVEKNRGGVGEGECTDVVNPVYDATEQDRQEGTYDDAEDEKVDLSNEYEDEVHNPYERLDEYQSRMVQ